VKQLFESYIFSELVEILTVLSNEILTERYFSFLAFKNALASWQLDVLALTLKNIYKIPRNLNEDVPSLPVGTEHLLSHLCLSANGLRLLLIDPRLRRAVTGAGLLKLINTQPGAPTCIWTLLTTKEGIKALNAILKENAEVRLYFKKELSENSKARLKEKKMSIEPPAALLDLSEAAWQRRLFDILNLEDDEALQTFIHEYNEVKFCLPATPDFFNCVLTLSEDVLTTPLNMAAVKNNVILMAMLVSAGAQPGLVLPNINNLPIHEAIMAGAFAALNYLITPEIGVDINAKNSRGLTGVFLAVIYDRIQAIVILGAAHASMNDKNAAGETPAMYATVNNLPPALQALIAAEADLDIRNNEDMAPVHVAAKNNFHDILALLIVADANINARIGCRLTGETALYIAVNELHLESVCTILRYPAAKLNLVFRNNMTVLFLAAKKHDARIFTSLFGKGADIAIPIISAPHHSLSLWRYLKYLPNKSGEDEMNFAMLRDRMPTLSAKVYGDCSKFEMIESLSLAAGNTCLYGNSRNIETFTQVAEMNDSYIMQAETHTKFIMVKKAKANISEWQPSWTFNRLVDLLIDQYDDSENEAFFNCQMYGVGAVYYNNRLLEVNDKGELCAYPECYIATAYIPGIPLTNFEIAKGEDYIDIFKSLLKNLKLMHKNFIHGSINSDNIMVDVNEREGGNEAVFEAKLINFNRSHQSGYVLNLECIDYYRDLPEFHDQKYIAVKTSQDVFALGQVLKKYYKTKLFPPAVANAVKAIIKSMLHKSPTERMTTKAAIKAFWRCEYLYQLEFLRKEPEELALYYEYAPASQCMSLINDTGINYFKNLIATIHDVVAISARLETVEEKKNFYFMLGMDFLMNLKTPDYNDHGSIIAYVNFVTSAFSKDRANELIKNLFSPLIMKKGFEAAFTICDKLTSSPKLSKQVLGVFNKIYQERRSADSRNYFSIFGLFSKADKLAASAKLDSYLENDRYIDFSSFALMQGDLGSIATRIHHSDVLDRSLTLVRPFMQR
jgi:ankyrin repeat protein/serine/threonine protein kinase